MGIDALVLAGDRKGAKLLYGTNKAFLYLRGKPLLTYVLSALESSKQVDKIHIVGPEERLRELLAEFQFSKPITYIAQGENIFENIWYGALSTFPEYQWGADWSHLKELKEKDKLVLVCTCDIPLLEPKEIDEFIKNAPSKDFDMVFGITRKEMLVPFAPKNGEPGISFAYFVMKDIIFRQANIFLLRPTRLGYVMEQFIPLVYQFRYQKLWRNIIRGFWIIAKLRVGGRALYYFTVLQAGRIFDGKGWRLLRNLARKGVSLERILEYVRPILQTRFTAFETIGPGPALDVDNEEDLAVFEKMFDRFKEIQREILEKRYPLPEKI